MKIQFLLPLLLAGCFTARSQATGRVFERSMCVDRMRIFYREEDIGGEYQIVSIVETQKPKPIPAMKNLKEMACSEGYDSANYAILVDGETYNGISIRTGFGMRVKKLKGYRGSVIQIIK